MMAETSVTVGQYSNGNIEIDPIQIRAESGNAYPLLIVPTKLSFSKIEQAQSAVPNFVVLSVQATLYLGSDSHKIADSIPIFDPLEFTNKRGASSTYSIEFPLDPRRARVIEASRRGDMRLRLQFNFLVAHSEAILVQRNNEPSQQNLIANYGVMRPRPEIQFNISQSHWVNQVIPALGFGEYFLIEIPKGKKTVPDAWDYLEKADVAFRNWNSKEVYGNCRELGSLLDQSIKNKFGTNDFSYSIRWKRAYSGFSDLASWSLHLEDLKKSPKFSPDTVQTNKSDAEHLLLRTKALLKYAEEILED
jgi:hypothetical protein